MQQLLRKWSKHHNSKSLVFWTFGLDASFGFSLSDFVLFSSARAIAEASYRTTVQAGGKNQKDLTVGWEVLGLDRATAERIFKEEAKEGFVTDREAMYGLQTQKYDKKGHRIDKEGKLENPEESVKDDDKPGDDGPVSNVYECSQCGFTLFVAQGRESKFFGQDFKCPECGAPKDKFKAREDLDE
jgi:rubrerythrin